MIKITLIAMGKLKENFLREAAAEYKKRLSRYCSLEVVEIDPVKLSEKPSLQEVNTALEKEAGLILKKIPQNSEVITLCVEGKEFSSEDFAQKINTNTANGKNITFIIGSSYGLSESIKKLSSIKLSISKMTFPHQLFRVMLLEQIYRGFRIINNEPYHK